MAFDDFDIFESKPHRSIVKAPHIINQCRKQRYHFDCVCMPIKIENRIMCTSLHLGFARYFFSKWSYRIVYYYYRDHLKKRRNYFS